MIYRSFGKLNNMIHYKILLSTFLIFFISLSSLNAQFVIPINTCSGAVLNYRDPAWTAGETYIWALGPITSASITGQTGGTGSIINQTLINSTNTPIIVNYAVVTSLSRSFTLLVTVNPIASITNIPAIVSPICSGINQNYTAVTDIAVSSTNWTRSTIAGISNLASAGAASITEALNNTTTAPITVPYTFALTTTNGCVSNQTINVVVNPIPTLTSSLNPPAICSGTNFTYNPNSATTLPSFTWTRGLQANISNPAASGVGNPNETLVNTSVITIPVTYVYTTTANGCSNSQNVVVPVNPTPVVPSPQTATACNNSSFIISPTGVPAGTQYSWTFPSAPGITGGSAQTLQNSISQTLSNSTSNPALATYTITPWAAGCSGPVFQGDITVSPIGLGVVIPNVSTTACNNTAFTVPITGPSGTQYIWSAPTYNPGGSITGGVSEVIPQNNIFGTLVNTTTAPAIATYLVTPVSGACTGTPFNVAVTINNPAILSSTLAPPAVCSNALFSYAPTSITTNTTFSWSRAAVPGISNTSATGIGNPNEYLINTTTAAVQVNYLYTLTTGSCVNQQTVSVFVNPSPVISSATPNPICSGSTFNYNPLSATTGTTFAWTRPVVPNISNIAASGTGNPNEVLINTGINPEVVTYNYTLTANGCVNTQAVNVLINPLPIINPNQIVSTCSGSSFSFTPSNVPTGTQYTWVTPTVNPIASLAGGLPQGTPQTSISGTLNNLTINPATATYVVTPSANGCVGSSFSLTVSVTAATNLTTPLIAPAICSNTTFSYAPNSNTFGTAFGWTRPNIVGIANTASSGAGNPNEILVNTTSAVIPVPYLFTLTTPTGCVSTQTVTVNVNPLPILSSNLVAAPICTGTLFNYTPTSLSVGSTYSWNRPVVPGISNAAGSGTGLNYPNEILVNTSSLPVTVSYNFVISDNTCTNNQTVTVIVNPKPVVANQTITICANSSFSVTPTGVIAGTQYTWTQPTDFPNNSITGSSAQTILQNNISQLLGNATLNLANATYTVTPSANGCIGSTFSVVVSVKPTPGISDQIIPSVCSGVAFNYAPTAVPAGTTYTWSSPIISPASSLTGGGPQPINQNSISETLVSNNNLIDTAIYTVTPSSGGCTGPTFALSVPIKPLPVVNNIFDTVCSGAGFNVVPSPVPANTSYTWTLPTSIPFGKIIGGSLNNVPVNVISQVPVNTGNTPGQILYTITPITNGCSGSTFTLLETVGVPLNPIANTTATICSGTAFDVTPVTVPANTKYTWTIQSIVPAGMISGTSTKSTPQTKITDSLINLSNVTATAIYAVVATNTGCSAAPFFATINVRAVPKATLTGVSTICAYANDTLSVNFAGTGPWSFDYLDNGVPKTQTGITTNPYTWIVPTPLLATTKSLTITRVNDMACVDSVDTSNFVQTVNPLPIGHVVSLHGQYICNNISDTLFVSHTLDTLTYQWTRNGVQIPNLTTDSISTLIPGRYNAFFTNQYGCTDTSAVPQMLTYIPQPVIKFTYDNYCIDGLISFKNLTDTTYIGPTTWYWDLGDSTTRIRFDAVTDYPTAGDRTIKLTALQLYCPAYTTTLDSVINIEAPIPGLRMPTVSAYIGQSTPIAARSIPNYKYLWTPTWGIDHPDSAAINFNFQRTQEYLINLIAPSGCVTYDTVLVIVFDNKLVDIFVPKSFTPNGDGVNDKLYPYLTGVKSFQYFKVYNRFGKLMFETRNPDEGWDGNVGGTPQPMSIYIWVAACTGLDGSLVERKGETLLLR